MKYILSFYEKLFRVVWFSFYCYHYFHWFYFYFSFHCCSHSAILTMFYILILFLYFMIQLRHMVPCKILRQWDLMLATTFILNFKSMSNITHGNGSCSAKSSPYAHIITSLLWVIYIYMCVYIYLDLYIYIYIYIGNFENFLPADKKLLKLFKVIDDRMTALLQIKAPS